MMKHMKKWMILMGIFCLVGMGTCGCGDDAKSSDTGQSEDSEDNVKNDTTQPAAPEGAPTLGGEIKELRDKELTVVESKTWEDKDGGLVEVAPGSGDDSGFNKLIVSYDENTVFSIRTIYDGGERYEDSEGSEKDLTEGMSLNVWGERSGETVKAEAVQLIKVVFAN